MDKTLQVQNQIRQNALEVSSYLADLSKWEKSAKQLDEKCRSKKVVERVNNVDNILNTQPRENGSVKVHVTSLNSPNNQNSMLTPATLADKDISKGDCSIESSNDRIPAPRGIAKNLDAEATERERGNIEFQKGNFQAAVRSYSRCLGLKSDNYIAFSNRAMAYLKLKEYHKVEMDCKNALRINPQHIKTFQRLAAARNALGKHRSALQDLLSAQSIDPSNKQIRSEVQKTSELLRSAVNNAPLVNITLNDNTH